MATLFSANYIASKLLMQSFSPMAFSWLRVCGSAIALNLLVPHVRLGPGEGRNVVKFALLGVVFNQMLFLGGLALTSANVAAILITTIPVFALAVAIARGLERATWQKTAGIALACFGALVAIGGEGFAGQSTRSVLGAAMIVLNCLSYATYLVLARPLFQRAAPVVVLARMFAAGAVLMLPICAWPLLRQDWSRIPPLAWLGLGLVIAGPTVGAYLLNAWALRHAESSLVAAYTYVQPVMATILAAIFLGEALTLSVAVAAVLIFAGVALAGRAPGPIEE